MPPPSERSLRDVLIEHAAAAIDEHGAAAVSLRDVARRAAVSHAAPAHHFHDKTGLLTATATATFDRVTAHLHRCMDRVGDDALERLTAAGTGYVGFATRHWRRFEFIFRHDLVDAHDGAYVRAGTDCLGVLVGAVNAARADGWASGRDPADLVRLCWATVHGLASLSASGALLATDDGTSAGTGPTSHVAQLIRLQLAGLSAAPIG